MIYFVRCPETNTVKIGFATDPWKRFSKIQSDSPGTLELLAIEQGGKSREAALHLQFADLRLRGEWFRFADSLKTYVSLFPTPEKPRSRKPLGGKLGQWLMRNGVSGAEFAARVETTAATISRICAGIVRPRAELMERIARVTQGDVLPNDFYDLSFLESDQQGVTPISSCESGDAIRLCVPAHHFGTRA